MAAPPPSNPSASTSFNTLFTATPKPTRDGLTLPCPPEIRPKIHLLKHRPTRTRPLDHNLPTPLAYTPYILGKQCINTEPLLLLSRRRDLANRQEKLDYYVATPDTYPFLTVLSNYMPDRHEFDRNIRPGMVLKFFGVCVIKRWVDVREENGSRFKAGVIDGARGHLNVFNHNPWPYFKVCTVYDGAGDGEKVEECHKLFKRWVRDEEVRVEEMRRRKEAEENELLKALEKLEREAQEQVKRDIQERERIEREKAKVDRLERERSAEEKSRREVKKRPTSRKSKIEPTDVDPRPPKILERKEKEKQKEKQVRIENYDRPKWLTGKPLSEKSEKELAELRKLGMIGVYENANGEKELKYAFLNMNPLPFMKN
ncbi:hypothetical protein EX30DRAFT_341921 [Ascodesmis nigricans]|uniref:Uncharacterized protein n=1 Tax=Ascodesmis nigricans TaxID=341454 RepID=A0A4S2MU68_9PEZI|nr:hypothetical protein EX30DRAFT_341921 [Ascodesmis nigricans]